MALLAGITLVAACDEDEPGPTIPDFDLAFTVSPTSITVNQDECAAIDASLTAGGTEVPNARIDFASANDDIAVFEGDEDDITAGVICGVDGGSTTFTVTTSSSGEDFSETVDVIVIDDALVSVEIRPASATLFLDATLALEADAVTAEGDTIFRRSNDPDIDDITIRPLTFTSSDAAVAKVSSGGVVTPVKSGTVLIIASREGKADTTTVTVTPRPVETVTVAPNPAAVFVGDTVHLEVTLKAANGKVLTGRDIVFTSSNVLLATVNEDGVVTGVAPGQVTITATSEGKSGSAEVVVTVDSTP